MAIKLVTFDVYMALIDIQGGLAPVAAAALDLDAEAADGFVRLWRATAKPPLGQTINHAAVAKVRVWQRVAVQPISRALRRQTASCPCRGPTSACAIS